MEVLFFLGRLVLGGFFVMNGLNHLTMVGPMTAYASSKGLPAPKVAVVVTGVQLLVGGAMLILGWEIWLGALILIVFLVPAAFWMHNFWTVQDPMARAGEMAQFGKNLALASALLIILVYNLSTDWTAFALGR